MPQISFIAERVAFVFSLLLFAKGIRKEYRLFFLYTFFVIIIESIGSHMAEDLKIKNHTLFTFACFFYTLFYFYTGHFMVQSKKFKKWIGVFSLLFLGFYVLNILFIQQLKEFNSYSFIVGYIFLIITSSFYFIEFISDDKILTFWKEPNFFIISGYFIYAVITALLYVMHGYFAYLKFPSKNFYLISHQLNNISNGSLYLLLAISFLILWIRKK